MNPVGQVFRDLIRISGPQSVARLMQMSLVCPGHGYYSKQKVFGQRGDFTTSPEISQLFGEMLALKFIQWADRHASDTPLDIVEIGPGRGTLLADMLRIAGQFERVGGKIAKCTLVEVSDRLKNVQRNTLKVFPYELEWVSSIDEMRQVSIGSRRVFILAHELFDALPVHIFQRQPDRSWRELLIALDRDERLCYVPSDGPTPVQRALGIEERFKDSKSDIVEVSPEATRIAQWMKRLMLSSTSSLALIGDYGQLQASGFTFRAIKDHKFLDNPLELIGECDLSADVNFSDLISVFEPECATQCKPQGQFLQEMGIRDRARMLALHNRANKAAVDSLTAGHDRLVDPKQMGMIYKILTAEHSQK